MVFPDDNKLFVLVVLFLVVWVVGSFVATTIVGSSLTVICPSESVENTPFPSCLVLVDNTVGLTVCTVITGAPSGKLLVGIFTPGPVNLHPSNLCLTLPTETKFLLEDILIFVLNIDIFPEYLLIVWTSPSILLVIPFNSTFWLFNIALILSYEEIVSGVNSNEDV